jgi:hypothetical protein
MAAGSSSLPAGWTTGAGAVLHQGEVGSVDRHPAAGQRVEAVSADEHPLLFIVLQGLGRAVLVRDALDERQHIGLLHRPPAELRNQGVLGRQAHERRPENGVVPRGENRDRAAAAFQREADLGPQALADPVLLHGDDLFRPSGQPVAMQEQVLGVAGDPEEPLPQLFLAHRLAAAPAHPGLHLLVGEHGLAGVAPVHVGLLAKGQAFLKHLQKEPLLPPVVLRPARGDFPFPVVAEAHPFELGAHVGDVGVGPPGRVGPVGNGGVLGWHPEGVPAHGVQHVETAHPLVARHHIADGVVAHVAHVNVAGRIRKHLQQVILGPVRVLFDPEQALGFPLVLPLALDDVRVVPFLHAMPSSSPSGKRCRGKRGDARECRCFWGC